MLATLAVLAAARAWPGWAAALASWTTWLLLPLAAAGLTSIAGLTARQRAATLAIGAVLVAGGIAGSRRPLGQLEAVEMRDRITALLPELTAEGSACGWPRTRASTRRCWRGRPRGLRRLLQDRAAVDAAVDAGLPVHAGGAGRAALELLGVGFREAIAIERPAPFVLHHVAARYRCVRVGGDRWSPLPGLEFTGRLGLTIPAWAGGRLDVIVGDDRRCGWGSKRRRTDQCRWPRSRCATAPAPTPRRPTSGSSRTIRWPRRTGCCSRHRRRPRRRPTRSRSAAGRRASWRACARCRRHCGRASARRLGPDEWFGEGDGNTEALPLDVPPYLGAGWHGLEREGPRPYRWTARESVLLLPSARRGAAIVELTARPAVPPTADVAVRVTPTLNGVALPALAMDAGERAYRWTVPASASIATPTRIPVERVPAVRPADRGAGDTRVLAMLVYGVTITLDR